jgi:thiol-disulfide isomerase/thioredoxin
MVSMLLIIGCTGAGKPVSTEPPASSIEPVSRLVLPAPSDPDQCAYLGIGASEEFSLNDIRAEVVLIEVFSMYCPHCQREAPNVNRLYRRITADPSLAGRVKMIGIGVGNTTYEVNIFRKNFDILFPLFPDRSRQLASQLEVRATPTFVAFAYGNNGRLHRILHAPGPLGNVEDFLARLIERADAAKGNSLRRGPPATAIFPASVNGRGAKGMTERSS